METREFLDSAQRTLDSKSRFTPGSGRRRKTTMSSDSGIQLMVWISIGESFAESPVPIALTKVAKQWVRLGSRESA